MDNEGNEQKYFSLPEAELVQLLRWLRPEAKPMITIRIE